MKALMSPGYLSLQGQRLKKRTLTAQEPTSIAVSWSRHNPLHPVYPPGCRQVNADCHAQHFAHSDQETANLPTSTTFHSAPPPTPLLRAGSYWYLSPGPRGGVHLLSISATKAGMYSTGKREVGSSRKKAFSITAASLWHILSHLNLSALNLASSSSRYCCKPRKAVSTLGSYPGPPVSLCKLWLISFFCKDIGNANVSEPAFLCD